MRTDYEYIVLGLGGIGSAAAYWLSRRFGAGVLGLEQFELGHVRGESQDHSRIIRLSYHRPDYVELAKRAYQAWAEVEADSGEQLVLRTGGLDFGPRDGAIPLEGYMGSMKACGVPFEHLDAGEIMRRWPQFRVDENIHGVFQAESGIAMAARANATHQRMAREHGATLRERAGITDVRPTDGEFEVLGAETQYRCRKIVIAAGPWSNEALSFFGMRLPLEVTKEQVTYFAAPDVEAFKPGRFPVWIWMDDPSFYGTPAFGEAGPKAAQDAGGKPVDPDTRSFEPDEENFARLKAFLERYIPSSLGPVIYTKTCLYTLTPDRDFIIDSLAGHPDVVMAIGAGHAFKFSSVIGKTLSELAADGAADADIAGFSLSRPILREANPVKSYMV
ncbi:MAG TPA: N-methyl-L-tryptophan oxidase [Candidatus Eremiobacteraceae bacterium]|nr:N-methyl-L-tryptophan oxidase [Candidatus Eremiobacteraceae bacterium]